jgi:hypothetical protein
MWCSMCFVDSFNWAGGCDATVEPKYKIRIPIKSVYLGMVLHSVPIVAVYSGHAVDTNHGE